jgi:hypothetical protein
MAEWICVNITIRDEKRQELTMRQAAFMYGD